LANIPISKIQEAWKAARKNLDEVVNFLSGSAYVDNSKALPTINVVIPILAYFSKRPRARSSKELKKLLYWTYAASMWGRYSGAFESSLDEDLQIAKQGDPMKIDLLVDNVLKKHSPIDVSPKDLEGRKSNNPLFRMMYLIARKNKAKDWATGTEVKVTVRGKHNRIEYHHIFPKAKLVGVYSKELINEVANLAFISGRTNREILNKGPEDYLPKVEAERLEAQFIPLDENLWKLNSFEKFIKKRREKICEAINGYMKTLIT